MARADARVVLVGPRAAGKSTVGRALAEALGVDFADTDDLLAERTGMRAGEYLERAGEPAFRAVEAEVVLAALAAEHPRVLALGGGAVLSAAVRGALRGPGLVVVHLDADPATLVARQEREAGTRPPLTPLPLAREVRALHTERAPLYAEVRDLVVDGGRSVADCVAAIRAALASRH